MSPTLLLLGGGLLVLTGLALALSVIGVMTPERRGAASSLAAIQALGTSPVEAAPGDESFVRRVVAPNAVRFADLGRRLSRAGAEERIQRRLDIAGNPAGWDAERILGLKIVALGLLGGLSLLFCLGQGSLAGPGRRRRRRAGRRRVRRAGPAALQRR